MNQVRPGLYMYYWDARVRQCPTRIGFEFSWSREEPGRRSVVPTEVDDERDYPRVLVQATTGA